MIPKVLAGLLLSLAATTPTTREQDARLPANIDELLARAMEHNPQVRLAAAKLEQARAELNAAQFDVTLKVLQTWRERELLQGKRDIAKIQFKRTQALFENGTLDQGAHLSARQTLMEVESELDAIADQLRYLAGIHRIAKKPSKSDR